MSVVSGDRSRLSDVLWKSSQCSFFCALIWALSGCASVAYRDSMAADQLFSPPVSIAVPKHTPIFVYVLTPAVDPLDELHAQAWADETRGAAIAAFQKHFQFVSQLRYQEVGKQEPAMTLVVQPVNWSPVDCRTRGDCLWSMFSEGPLQLVARLQDRATGRVVDEYRLNVDRHWVWDDPTVHQPLFDAFLNLAFRIAS